LIATTGFRGSCDPVKGLRLNLISTILGDKSEDHFERNESAYFWAGLSSISNEVCCWSSAVEMSRLHSIVVIVLLSI